ncbi:MAG TPA: carboxypeptidase-like regulatory domain-containing protein [Kofleriaceae bacterium]|nr:carboxypeptidase-like regulatory domain-containing protein [Kofleriaceae bacterium]
MTRGLRAIAVVIAVHAGTVAAQPAPTPAPAPDTSKLDAKSLMQLGVKLLKSQDFLGALAVFKEAYRRFPSARILLDIGTTLRALGRNAESANAYQRFLDSADKDPQLRAEVTKDLAELDVALARLAITAPVGAELQVDDGDWIPAQDAALARVTPGKYTVRARRDGFQAFETTGDIAVGQQTAVTVALVPVPEKEVIVRVPERPVTIEERRSRLGALAFGHFDLSSSSVGAAGLVGATFDATDRLELQGAGIVGPNFGGYLGASFSVLTGTFRPQIAAGMPVFVNSGPRYAVRGALGLEVAANRHFALIVEVGVEHDLNPQSQLDFNGMPRSVTKTTIIPALGASARL